MKDFDPNEIVLSAGSGRAPEDACLQQKANLVFAHTHGLLTPGRLHDFMGDHPCWQNQVINVVGIFVNDYLPEGGDWFDRLDKLTPRMASATVAADSDIEHRINARLLCWLAREVLHLFEDRFPEDDRPRKSIETREAWLRGEATEDQCAEAARAAWAAGAAWAAWAAGTAGTAEAAEAAWAAGAAWAAWAARAAKAERLIRMLEELCDQHDKAKAEEGVVLDDGWHQALSQAGLIKDATTP